MKTNSTILLAGTLLLALGCKNLAVNQPCGTSGEIGPRCLVSLVLADELKARSETARIPPIFADRLNPENRTEDLTFAPLKGLQLFGMQCKYDIQYVTGAIGLPIESYECRNLNAPISNDQEWASSASDRFGPQRYGAGYGEALRKYLQGSQLSLSLMGFGISRELFPKSTEEQGEDLAAMLATPAVQKQLSDFAENLSSKMAVNITDALRSVQPTLLDVVGSSLISSFTGGIAHAVIGSFFGTRSDNSAQIVSAIMMITDELRRGFAQISELLTYLVDNSTQVPGILLSGECSGALIGAVTVGAVNPGEGMLAAWEALRNGVCANAAQSIHRLGETRMAQLSGGQKVETPFVLYRAEWWVVNVYCLYGNNSNCHSRNNGMSASYWVGGYQFFGDQVTWVPRSWVKANLSYFCQTDDSVYRTKCLRPVHASWSHKLYSGHRFKFSAAKSLGNLSAVDTDEYFHAVNRNFDLAALAYPNSTDQDIAEKKYAAIVRPQVLSDFQALESEIDQTLTEIDDRRNWANNDFLRLPSRPGQAPFQGDYYWWDQTGLQVTPPTDGHWDTFVHDEYDAAITLLAVIGNQFAQIEAILNRP